ncbi:MULTISPECIES: homoserine kinase [Bacillaceae]|uniref:homoserine kinase n=1 Tax=Bacillaceae TaxID=186817 RepID=UPI000C784DC6|nr:MULTISPECIES: homoserine kinase [Bacillus]MDW2879732.1 homoserine kinase [Bacillus infantis]PLR73917.1 homoserine kinase [Bacillus sp. UMB0728]
MMEGEMLTIRVPASTANLGPGFDSVGLALSLYLTVEAERAGQWEVVPESSCLEGFPRDSRHLIVQAAKKAAEHYSADLPPCILRVKSDIPLARGLGSSGAAIVAGIELADSLCGLGLSRHEKLCIAGRMEGHPDNVGASLFGGLVIGYQTGEEVLAAAFQHLGIEVLAVVPQEELLTKESRGALPASLTHQESVQAGAAANLLIAALLQGNYELAGKMMQKDLYHQPYRRKLVPHLDMIEEKAAALGVFGTALSGAGPAVVCFIAPEKGDQAADALSRILPQMDVLRLSIDQKGSTVSRHAVSGR